MEPAAMERKNLTDRFIDSRKAAPPGERLEYPDAIVPGLYLRVTDRGHKSYALVARYPLNPKHPTRRALGDVGAISLADVREKAREWLQLIGKGIDPKVEEDRQRAAQLRRQANSFAAVAAEFLERHASKLAKKDEAETIFENEFTKRWANRPVTDVTTLEVATAIRAIVARGSPYQAHNAFGHLRKFFNWAIATGEYGIEASPVERLRPSELIGKREARARTLNDDELRWVWEAAGQLGYPYGPLVRILILTGQRKSQVAEMPRSEIDQRKQLWTIPAQRMKSDAAHLVPLAPDAAALLESLPAWTEGDFVFTTTGGKQPVNGFSKAKARLDKFVDALRVKETGAAAPAKKPMEDWTLQDLRRTMRTHLSALPVQDLVRELVIAHAKPGLHKVYDLYAYSDEKRHCLELWEKRLKGIVEPAPADVSDLAKERARRRASAK
jgi:integrase